MKDPAAETRTNGDKRRRPLVELRELAPTDFVSIFGKRYDVLDLDSLSIRQRAIIGAHYERIQAIEQLGAEATDDDEREYAERVAQAVPLIVPTLPKAVLNRIPLGKRAELLGAFLGWVHGRSLLGQMMTRRAASASSSRGSRSPTERANG
ncbi:MAG: hypothetical protein M3T56_10325 [Chloroflexota bacterium]|nr:hypothetical protein [Chloroflexota bacterium]